IGAVKERYRDLIEEGSTDDPAELARLAETLGRPIEARGWSLIRDGKASASRRGPSRERLVPEGATPSPAPGQTLAERCADLRRGEGTRPTLANSASVLPHFVDDAESCGLRFVHE